MRLCLLFALASLLMGSCQDRADEEEAIRKRAEGIASVYADMGLDIDLSEVTFKIRTEAELEALEDVDSATRYHREQKQITKVIEEVAYEPTTIDAEEFRSAYKLPTALYRAQAREVCFVEGMVPRQSYDNVLAHELAHVWRFQQSGLEASHQVLALESDRRLARDILLEGEAQLLQRVCALRRANAPTPEPAVLGGVGLVYPLAASGTIDKYSIGLSFALDRVASSDWKPMNKCFESPPPSTEQVMHPEKFGADKPTEIHALEPDIDGLQHVADYTMGELMTLMLLLRVPKVADPERVARYRDESRFANSGNDVYSDYAVRDAGQHMLACRLAASGWDGDRLSLFETETGLPAVFWRTEWDTIEDAVAFAEEISRNNSLRVARSDLSVFVIGPVFVRAEIDGTEGTTGSQAHPYWDEMRQFFLSLPNDRRKPDSNLPSSRSDERIREQWQVYPYLADGYWVHPALGFRLAASDGWEIKDAGRGPTLSTQWMSEWDPNDPEAAEFSMSWIQIAIDPLPDQSLDDFSRSVLAEWGNRTEMSVAGLEAVPQIGGFLVSGEADSRSSDQETTSHSLVFDHRGYRIILSGFATDSRHAPDDHVLLQAMRSIEFGDFPPRTR